jgi:hypothetical protein
VLVTAQNSKHQAQCRKLRFDKRSQTRELHKILRFLLLEWRIQVRHCMSQLPYKAVHNREVELKLALKMVHPLERERKNPKRKHWPHLVLRGEQSEPDALLRNKQT